MTEKPNYDENNCIHYGYISQHTPNQDASSCVFDGRDLTYEAALEEARGDKGLCIEEGWLGDDGEFDEQKFGDNYQPDESTYLYVEEGYEITNTSSSFNCFAVSKSQFFTYTKGCSPCMPNAGDLDNPRDGGLRTYCLGHDWFDGETAPYPIWTVEDSNQVIPIYVGEMCVFCKGTGQEGHTTQPSWNLPCQCWRCRGTGTTSKMIVREVK